MQQFPRTRPCVYSQAPGYHNKPSQETVSSITKCWLRLPKPIILYNVPGRPASTTIRLANEVPNIAGIKEASGDMFAMHGNIARQAIGFPGCQQR